MEDHRSRKLSRVSGQHAIPREADEHGAVTDPERSRITMDAEQRTPPSGS